MISTSHTTQSEDHELEKIADQLEADVEMHEATLDGLQTRINENIAALEDPAMEKNNGRR